MRKEGNEVHLSKTEARAGSTPHVTRYVLGISTLLIIVLFAVLLLLWR